MPKLQKRNLDPSNVELEINLDEIFDQKVDFTEEQVTAIGQTVIDIIDERTRSGKDMWGKAFAKYSNSYINSDEFSIYKDSKKPDLVLRDEMLNSMTIKKATSNKVIIGFDGEENSAKAHAHITNHNGDWKITPRDFFGINASDVTSLKKEFADFIDTSMPESSSEPTKKVSDLMDQLSTLSALKERFFG